MEIITLPVGRLQTNCYLLSDPKTRTTLIIDPGDDAELIAQKILDEDLQPLVMLATHGHFDHVMAAFELQENFKIPFYLDPKDEFLLNRLSQTASHFLGEKVEVWPPREISPLSVETIHELSLPEELTFKIISTPGHTPGSVSFYFPNKSHPKGKPINISLTIGSSMDSIPRRKVGVQNDKKCGYIFVGDVLFAGGGYGRTDFSYCSSLDLQDSITSLFELPDETIIYSGHGEESSIGREKKYYQKL